VTLVMFHGLYRVYYDNKAWYNVVDNRGIIIEGFLDEMDAIKYTYELGETNAAVD
jgi:hypothetical protein